MQSPCLVNLPPANRGWSASSFGLSLLSMYNAGFRLHPGGSQGWRLPQGPSPQPRQKHRWLLWYLWQQPWCLRRTPATSQHRDLGCLSTICISSQHKEEENGRGCSTLKGSIWEAHWRPFLVGLKDNLGGVWVGLEEADERWLCDPVFPLKPCILSSVSYVITTPTQGTHKTSQSLNPEL